MTNKSSHKFDYNLFIEADLDYINMYYINIYLLAFTLIAHLNYA